MADIFCSRSFVEQDSKSGEGSGFVMRGHDSRKGRLAMVWELSSPREQTEPEQAQQAQHGSHLVHVQKCPSQAAKEPGSFLSDCLSPEKLPSYKEGAQ